MDMLVPMPCNKNAILLTASLSLARHTNARECMVCVILRSGSHIQLDRLIGGTATMK